MTIGRDQMNRMYQPQNIGDAVARNEAPAGLQTQLRAAWLRGRAALSAWGTRVAVLTGARLSELELRRRLARGDRPGDFRSVAPRNEMRERDFAEILTAYDRQRIAEIRAELDQEFESLPGGQAVPLETAEPPRPRWWRPSWSWPGLPKLGRPWTSVSWPNLAWPRVPVAGRGALALAIVGAGVVALAIPWLGRSSPGPAEPPTLAQTVPLVARPPEPQTASVPPGATGVQPADTGVAAMVAPPAKAEPPGEATEQEALRDALGQWLAATRRRDIAAQMKFYPNVVPVYYSRRNVPRETVRSEKTKTLARARTVEIQAGPPTITLDRDGRSAAMRFMKQFAITGPTVTRRGRVLQELRWSKIGGDWKIVGERDAKVPSRS
jgi:hypothetical protein